MIKNKMFSLFKPNKYLFILFILFAAGLNLHSAFAEELGVPLHGFADVGWGTSSGNTPRTEKAQGFSMGTLDFYLTPEFAGSVKSLIELAVEPSPDTGEINMDLERLQAGYEFGDYLTLWLGRFHTPYGYWNTAYHHGAQLQTSINRPRMIDFEDKGSFLPAHSVGLWAKGQLQSGFGKLVYNFYVANGPRLAFEDASSPAASLDPNYIRSDRVAPMLGGSLAWNFSSALQGLKIGAHAFMTKVNVYSPAQAPVFASTDVNMMGGFLVYENYGLQVISELYSFSDKATILNSAEVTNATQQKSWSGFAQISYAVLEDWIPFVRVERAQLKSEDPYFLYQESGQSYDRVAAGLRYNLDDRSALKFEWQQTKRPVQVGENLIFNVYQAQYAIRF